MNWDDPRLGVSTGFESQTKNGKNWFLCRGLEMWFYFSLVYLKKCSIVDVKLVSYIQLNEKSFKFVILATTPTSETYFEIDRGREQGSTPSPKGYIFNTYSNYDFFFQV